MADLIISWLLSNISDTITTNWLLIVVNLIAHSFRDSAERTNRTSHAKTWLWTSTDSVGPDQTARKSSLLRAFAVHFQDHWIL